MKKINLLFAVLFSAIAIFTVGCDGEDPTGPSLDVDASVTTAWQGDSIVFTYSVSSNADLKTLTWTSSEFVLVDGSQEDEGTIELSGTSVQDETLTIFIKGTQSEGDITFSFVAEDKDGAEFADEVEIVITIEAPVVNPSLTTFTQKLMGASSSSYGSYLNTAEGIVYTQTEVADNDSKIDLVYKWVDDAGLYSPTDDAVSTVLSNTTLLGSYTGTEAFDDIDADDVAALATPSNSNEKSLSVGDLVVFKTAAGKMGILKIDALVDGDSGDITVTGKVQQ